MREIFSLTLKKYSKEIKTYFKYPINVYSLLYKRKFPSAAINIFLTNFRITLCMYTQKKVIGGIKVNR